MKLKTSFFNINIIIEDLKRYWGISALYFIFLFLVGPFSIFSRLNEDRSLSGYSVREFFMLRTGSYGIIVALAVGIGISVIIYRYLQNSDSTSMVHSMPITRAEIFNSHNISAFLLMFVPVLLIAITFFMFIFNYSGNDEVVREYITYYNVSKWIITIMTMNLFVYLLTCFAGMLTGISMIQGILSFVFVFLPIGLSVMILMNLQRFLYGFSINDGLFIEYIAKIFPITAFMFSTTLSFTNKVVYIVLLIALYLITFFVYQKRPLESAGESISFDVLKPVFKYGFTFCVMSLFGMYFDAMMPNTSIAIYIGYIVGSILGYIIAEMIIQKSIWIFKNFKGLIYYCIAICLLLFAVKFDIFGYENRIPNTNDIKKVYYSDHYSRMIGDIDNRYYEDKNNIENIKNIHKSILAKRHEFDFENGSRFIEIRYQYDNGLELQRSYSIPSDFFEKNINVKKLHETKEFKFLNYNIFKNNKIDAISFRQEFKSYEIEVNNKTKLKQSPIEDRQQINELVKALRKDILELSYEELNNAQNSNRIMDIRYFAVNSRGKEVIESYDLYWDESFKNTVEYLKSIDKYDETMIRDNIKRIILLDKVQDEYYNIEEFQALKEKMNIFENKDQIDFIVDNMGYMSWSNSHQGMMELNNGDKYIIRISIDDYISLINNEID
ncbi:MAG: ABC transporter permease [Peptostreptococcaceae bacterium]|jgi:ABC-2 type transport system permease protein|nr:ABC transporter permease [Peptostreptococcaceae bacterium]